jgi:hypothetical protein
MTRVIDRGNSERRFFHRGIKVPTAEQTIQAGQGHFQFV